MTNAQTYEPGAKVEGVIPLCVPEIRGNEAAYVKDCIDTGWVSSVGSYVTRFEHDVAAFVDRKHGIAVVNGTAALHMALLLSGVEADDEVLVSTLTFIAPANAIRYIGAHPVFIDCEPTYWQMDPQAVERFLREECHWDGNVLRDKANGRRVKAIVPVDVLGSPVDFDAIAALAREFQLAIVEDTTESLGTLYRGAPAGHEAPLTCYSFNGNKLITTGGGGMIVTDDDALAKRARYLTTQAKDDPIEYIHGAVGYNYRLTNIQAAMGVAQMENLADYIALKRSHAAKYAQTLAGISGITPMPEATYATSTYWLYTILVDEHAFGMTSRGLLEHLTRNGIQSRPLWQPLHRSPAYVGSRRSGGDVAESICARALSLPSSVGLTEDQLDTVVSTIASAARR